MPDTTCLNCNTRINAGYEFCPKCGQKATAGRLTLKHIVHDVIHAFFHADRGIFSLIKELAKRPGIVAKEYVEGKRKKYFNPFTFLVLVVGLSTFAFSAFNVLDNNSSQQNPINNYIYKHYNLIVFFNVPLIAFFSWLVYRKSGRNYAENLVLAALLSGERALAFSLFIAPLFYFFPGASYIILGVYVFLWFLYFAWGATQFFAKQSFRSFLQGMFVPFLTQAITTGIITAAIFSYFYAVKGK